ncbi:MAG: hypothetical protein HYZ01_12985 [Ignavibacteriales bacterium]|nr:hypothetical protein [Ignavibacteriales bacterium]
MDTKDTKLGLRLVTVLRQGYTGGNVFSGLTGLVNVGIVSLPLAIASRFKPEQWIMP